MRAVSLHSDVIVVTSQLLQAHCTIIRGPGGEEAFVVDSPVLPEELELLPSLLAQAGFPQVRGLLATHADWDHLLARIAFPQAPLGCAESTAARLRAAPGAAQRELRAFDQELLIERARPLALGSIQALAVPGRCRIENSDLELHGADGHTPDGMAVWIPWASVLIAGDYLSPVEIPTIAPTTIGPTAIGPTAIGPATIAPAVGQADAIDAYLATLERLSPLVARASHVVPGHGPIMKGARAHAVLEEDRAYLQQLSERGLEAVLPAGRRNAEQRRLHGENVAHIRA